MADIIPGIIPLKCPSTEYIAKYNDPPYSGMIDNVNRTEFITVTN